MFSFTSFHQNQTEIGKFKTLPEAMKGRPYKVQDTEGLTYFSDGTGTGFSSIKESNEGMWHSSHDGIYNQRKKSAKSIKAVSWHIYWETKSLESVKSYHQRVRNLIKIGALKVLKD